MSTMCINTRFVITYQDGFINEVFWINLKIGTLTYNERRKDR